ncbi:MAG: ATP-binding protein [Candidatus Obscuribacter sp.]|nr:ATP-binding protein [Candidatus Obscuribacter sp.]MBK9277054.1 ATP-binding protein [Candidatus Obscuribacter sp.]
MPGKINCREYCGVKIKTLADFLTDHTLLQEKLSQRLPEHYERWTQFVKRLSVWKKSVFCLRFNGQPADGTVGVYLLAKPSDPNDRDCLQADLEFALSAYGILPDVQDTKHCLSLLSPKQIEELPLSDLGRKRISLEVEREFGKVLAPGLCNNSVFAAVMQDAPTLLFEHEQTLRDFLKDEGLNLDISEKSDAKGWLPNLWAGPSGPFLIPFKALMSTRSPVQISVYLQPHTMTVPERIWIKRLALFAQTEVQQTSRFKDPLMAVASQQAINVVRRLEDGAFATCAVVAALDGNTGAAQSVAHTLQALCLRSREESNGKEGEWLATARLHTSESDTVDEARQSHESLSFPKWCDVPGMPQAVRKLPYLSDARGAATVFRLPVSVRGGVAGVSVEQPIPDFTPGLREEEESKNSLLIGKFQSGGYAYVPVDDFAKHTLITGFTGSGKTQTVMNLIHQLWSKFKIPFLVIESAKTEYRGLLNFSGFECAEGKKNLLVYTLGNESLVPFRLNPFQLLPGVRAEAHINRLQSCFEATLPPFGPMSSILEQSLIEVYRDQGWMMTDEGVSEEELSKQGEFSSRRYPNMSEFAKKLEEVAESRKYQGENRATVLAAVSGRIRPLTRIMSNSKGMMLDTESTRPSAAMLFSTPSILEMNDLNIQDKALVSMFLLTLLREHRELEHKNKSKPGLQHVTVIEEAHNVLENVRSYGSIDGAESDIRYKAVQSFCSMLAEVRALGEGLIIADQSPEKLAPDAMRNTNIQIAHQLRDARDRQSIANTMTMSEEQRDYLGKLKPGYAAVFYTGLQRASFVKVPRFDRPELFKAQKKTDGVPSDKEVRDYMADEVEDVRELVRPFIGCYGCGHIEECSYKWSSRNLVSMLSVSEEQEFVDAFITDVPDDKRFAMTAEFLRNKLPLGADRDRQWCLLLHLKHRFLRKASEGGISDESLFRVFCNNVVD